MEHTPNFGPDFGSLAEKPNEDDDETEERPSRKKRTATSLRLPGLFELPKADQDNKAEQGAEDRPAAKQETLSELFNDDNEDEPAEAERVGEATPLESLGADEKVAVALDYVEQRSQAVQQEAETAETPELEAAVNANALLLEHLGDKLTSDNELNDEVLDEALAEAAAEIGLELNDDVPEESNLENDNTAYDLDDATAATATSSSAGGSMPPLPPLPPPPPKTPPGGSGLVPPPLPGPAVTQAINMNAVPRPGAETTESHSHVPYVLAGGIVGYLLGRRRGRIKTEKKLKPIQKKLEAEVADLSGKIARREQQIRTMAARQTAAVASQLEQKAIEPSPAQASTETVENVPVAQEGIVTPQEARQTIGRFAIRAEAPPATIEKVKSPQSMKLPELLAVAKNIKFNGVDLKTIYERRQIEQEDMRKIIRSYLRGERYDRLIRDALGKSEIRVATAEKSNVPNDYGQQAPVNSNLPSSPVQTTTDQLLSKYNVQAATPELSGYNYPAEPSNRVGSKPPNYAALALTAAIATTLVILVWFLTR